MSTQSTIYLDYASTTPVDPRVASKMMQYLTPDGEFGNPASRSHRYGWKADDAVEEARSHVANLVNCDPREIVWTSGATEADNLAIKGVARFYKSKGNHIITSKIEHKAVLDPCRQLEREGFEVTYLDPNEGGIITAEAIKNAMQENTILVSVMHINNELGTLNNLEEIGKITREAGAFFHVDAAQSTGKVDIDLSKLPVDLMSFSAHKTYGPKGIGALFVRRKPRVRIEALIHGGGHERGMRSGTLPTHQIVGMGEAFKIAKEEMESDHLKIKAYHEQFLKEAMKIEHAYINGDLNNKVPNILNISFNFVEGESLIMGLKDIAVSSGSACTSASLEPSYVLRALGRKDELAHSSIRFSFGRFTSDEDIENTLSILNKVVDRLRELSPLWEMHLDGIDLDTVKWNTH
ncbi:IscS subfamily cysteine desulfurase [Gammaproteobacteria bacterium]|jgi:cysteine desulfurase|nr:IscS subfamily cysteine desulfurase [Gammaproteobacteria bacterium]MDA7735454.1 IscS subfamily cysteine desulfurase [Gammaproteobacteria bacterium]MDA7812090.1 IscS subfamily cysteine desulfurase [Gammaproteobacteria bacterium]MDA7821858.1 IscS subfamily cysteine desulfurase [Gammaproteobacteria bacterium]MDA7857541.1 IscS subfamily cysteine desulfurase [Gammaproteobacteria bacterium]|tara:strand:+ start:7510 stop:8730 length:1221 start_codon:yes stop_codon:yes gene_type:complete